MSFESNFLDALFNGGMTAEQQAQDAALHAEKEAEEASRIDAMHAYMAAVEAAKIAARCPRCMGEGRIAQFQNIKGGSCFQCGGSGVFSRYKG